MVQSKRQWLYRTPGLVPKITWLDFSNANVPEENRNHEMQIEPLWVILKFAKSAQQW
jgi:hypothetical protein